MRGRELDADFDALRRERIGMDDEIDAFVATLSSEKLAGNLRFRRRGGVSELPLWHAVARLFGRGPPG